MSKGVPDTEFYVGIRIVRGREIFNALGLSFYRLTAMNCFPLQGREAATALSYHEYKGAILAHQPFRLDTKRVILRRTVDPRESVLGINLSAYTVSLCTHGISDYVAISRIWLNALGTLRHRLRNG